MNILQMVQIMGRYGRFINLVFVAIGSYFIADATSSVIESKIRMGIHPPVVGRSSARSALKKSVTQNSPLSAIAIRNLLGSKREDLHPVQLPDTPAEDDSLNVNNDIEFDDSELKACTVGISLRATLVAEDAPEWSTAVIYNNSKRENGVYSINPEFNQIAPDATLVAIRSRAIVVRRREHFELCRAEGEKKKVLGKRAPKVNNRAASSGSGGGTGVTKVGASEYEIEGEVIEDTLNNLSKVATQARIVPNFKRGKPNGFKLFSIKPRSIFSKIGLQNGDVIQKINGYEMNSPDKALEIYSKLKDATSISIEFERRGQSRTFGYSIKR